MEDGNSHGDCGLKLLLDVLENDDPNWLSTNEFDDLLANLQALEALIWATSKSPVLWKWVIVAAHTTLQSLAVCKLTRTDGFGAKNDDIEKKIGTFYADGKSTLHNYEEFEALAAKENMANFPTLMRRLGYDLPKPEHVRKEQDATNLALYLLHDFRSTYSHYPPIQLTLEASRVRDIVRITVDILTSEFEKGGWKRRPLITLDEVTPLLASIRRRFEDFEKE
ncbi:hypothetical protein N9E38_02495 [Yoonia sp.]|nr:hypothetical protein [Yoonia sp.]MDC1399168.1 hypothetical protein [Yoonia sp.]